jgi:DNA-binding GntR family transcriptional regulator
MAAKLDLFPVTAVRTRLSDSVFDSLCDAIVEGILTPGERLPEERLAKALKVSRMPVREALADLERRHLVERDQNGTCCVAKWDKVMLREVATLRSALEGLAVKFALPNLAPEDIDQLEGIITQMERGVSRGDYERLIHLDISFHSHIWSCTGHTLLQDTLAEMKPQVRYFMYLTRPGDEETYPDTHREVLEVLRLADAERAEAVIREHTLTTAERAIARLQLNPSVT